MGYARTTTTSRVRNKYELPKADDAEATVSSYVHNDAKLHQPATTSESGGTKM